MGWKASAIIIHRPTQIDAEELLQKLGFSNLKRIEDETFDGALNPDDNSVYIGFYKENLLICAPDIPMLFFEEFETPIEKTLKEIFPNAEICSIILQSTVNLWGFAVIMNGQKIRARAGSAEDGTFIEIGEPLDEEKELLSKSKLDENGSRIYFLDDFPNEPFHEDQVGENLVFSICKRYFGEELNNADALLFGTTLRGYKYNKKRK